MRRGTPVPGFAASAAVRCNAFTVQGALVVNKAPARPAARSMPRAAAFRLADADRWEVRVATARAITPMRRPVEQEQQRAQENAYTEELPSMRRTDTMAPARTGFWSVIPYVAGLAVIGAAGFVAAKRLQARQRRLVDDFGEVAIYYGNTEDALREIVQDYKRRLGPGVMRNAMYQSYLRNLVTEKPVGPAAIKDASYVKSLLNIGDAKAVGVYNELAGALKESPSLLGKLLFIGNRALEPDVVSGLEMTELFPYGAGTVSELQRNMVERCFRELVDRALQEDDSATVPLDAAASLRLDVGEATKLFDGVVLSRIKAKEDEAAAIAAMESEDHQRPAVADLDYPARSAEPAKAAVHAYQCSVCGYTIFPAAGREFKFFGAEFVCPTCGAPKDKFVDLNADEE